jgi:hypothetical protein
MVSCWDCVYFQSAAPKRPHSGECMLPLPRWLGYALADNTDRWVRADDGCAFGRVGADLFAAATEEN